MDTLINNFLARLGNTLPNLAIAFAILIVGWIVAWIIGKLLREALKRTTLDNRLAMWITGSESPKQVGAEEWISRSVYYLLLLVVLGVFFSKAGLREVSEPLNNFTNQIFGYAPRILSAGVILLIAWIIARILQFIILNFLTRANLDERFNRNTRVEEGREIPLAQMLSNTVYWLVFLFFLPAALDALNIQGLLTPVQDMMNRILGFLPNLFASVLIFVVGWFLSRIVSNIVINLLSSVGVDEFGDRIGLSNILGPSRLSNIIGQIVSIFILIPVGIAALNALKLEAITLPASNMLNNVLTSLPNILSGILLVFVGYLVGRIVGDIVTNFLAGIGFDSMIERAGITAASPENKRPSEIAGIVVMVAIILFLATEAFRQLGFNLLAQLTTSAVVSGGKVLVGLLVFAVGVYLSNLAARAIRTSGITQAGMIATVARILILILATSMALSRMGIANDIINLAFGLTLGAVAVAAALAFGLGGRDAARQVLDDTVNSMKGRRTPPTI